MDVQVNEEIQRLLDKQSIYEVLVRYCRGVDRCDEDLLRSAFHSDSYDDHGYWKGPGHELATFLADRLRNANSATTHSITNVLIELDGDLAVSESQVHATLIRRGEGPVQVDVVGARYLDRSPVARIPGGSTTGPWCWTGTRQRCGRSRRHRSPRTVSRAAPGAPRIRVTPRELH